jgi:membrane-bound metal-dependent hydrolase YbcI (DUF457 family)
MIGVVLGHELERVHRRATHSLIVLAFFACAAVAIVSTTAWAASPLSGLVPSEWVLIWSVVLLSHPLLDLVTTGPPEVYGGHGPCLLWPLTARRWVVPRPLVRPPSFEQYASGEAWRRLWSEFCLFAPACATLVVLGYVL